jgi:glucose-6-phosphate 1-dehydrogenase
VKQDNRIEWQETLCVEQHPGPFQMVIFGASGDLSRRKLFPSLLALYQRGLLAEQTRILGCGRQSFTDESFRAHLAEGLSGEPPAQVKAFLSLVFYHAVDYAQADAYQSLARRLEDLDTCQRTCLPRLYYLAVPATLYPDITRELHSAGLLHEADAKSWRHVVFEKPFGFDLAGAKQLDQSLRQYLHEKQIYRIDHYLGKETVQNIFLLRFANVIFEPIWNAHYIDNIQITAAEAIGVENRAGYFDQAGILRDMFQNHMLEMLSLVAMECPSTFAADAVRDEKVKLLRSIRPLLPTAGTAGIVRGQYDGYRREPGVPAESQTETYAALRLYIDNMRWKGVPFYLRAGKKLARKNTAINVVFKHVPHSIFPNIPAKALQQDVLHLRIQPAEGMGLTLQAKMAGPKLCMGAMTLNYNYLDSGEKPLDAYARLLLDCSLVDQTLFIRSDIILAAWELYQPVLDWWENQPQDSPLLTYAPGGNGPAQADALLATDGRQWV